MTNANVRFIAIPISDFFTTKGLTKHIEYKDLLTYATLRSYHNTKANRCYPSYETLAEKSGMCRDYIIQSVARLELYGIIKIKRSKKKDLSNQYYFAEFEHFERIPFELLDAEISSTNKAVLLLLRFVFGSFLMTSRSITSISKELGMTYDTLYPRIKALVKLGYLEIRYHKGDTKKKQLFLTDKINWKYDFRSKKAKVKEKKKTCVLKVG